MLDTTISSATANSYLSLFDADAGFNGNPFFGSTWISISDAEKEFWLKHATRSLDRMFSYKGHKAESEQSLQFPRRLTASVPFKNGVNDTNIRFHEDHYYFDPSSIHIYIKEGLLELIPLLHREKGSSDTGTVEGREEESISILNGLAQISYKDRKSSDKLQTLAGGTVQSIRSLMKPWIRSAKIVR
jgi:hypothetical protein